MSATAQPAVVIVGAGFAGLGLAMELQRAGFTNFTILEKAADIGGVWRENTYPGAGCDVPSPLYSWSFEPKHDWPKRFSLQADIHEYMRTVAEKHGVIEHIRFGIEVTDAEFDTGRWTIRTLSGEVFVADLFVPAVGQLSRPALPNIPGIESFCGTAFHSAQWNHDIDLRGKRVAVIGTGASAIQFIPAIAPDVEHLTLFQRSAAWILPKPDAEYTAMHHAVFKYVPPVRLAERFATWAFFEVMALALTDIPQIKTPVIAIADRHRRNQVPDAKLRAKLTPDYAAGCKRGLFSNEYFPTLARDNVTVDTTAIAEITPAGVRTADGVEHPVDVIVYGTGFKGTEFLAPINIFGTDGRKLADVWAAAGGRAYLGMAVPDFPNMLILYGPNTNVGSGSIVYMLETQARYIRQAVAYLAKHPGARFDVRADVEERYDVRIQKRLAATPWNFCSSWYRNASGRITNNWPGPTALYRWWTATFEVSDYVIEKAG